jgi:hypothetical protein
MKACCFALHRFTTIRAGLKNTRLHLAIALKVTQSWSEFGWRSASKVALSETTGPFSAELAHNPINEMVRRLISTLKWVILLAGFTEDYRYADSFGWH